MLEDPEFARRMIGYLDSVISERIDPCESDDRSNELSLPSTRHFETDQGYVNALHEYGNAVASNVKCILKSQLDMLQVRQERGTSMQILLSSTKG